MPALWLGVIRVVTKPTENTTLRQLPSLRQKDHLNQHLLFSCHYLQFWGTHLLRVAILGGHKI